MHTNHQFVPASLTVPEPTIPINSPATSAEPDFKLALSIVTNSQLLREGLITLLAAHLNFTLCGSYNSELGIPPAPPGLKGEIVLLDGNLEPGKLTGWIQRWRGLDPPTLVVVMELTDDAELVLTCIEAGANGYTLRGASVAELAEVIRQVRQGVASCSPQITARLFARLKAYSAASVTSSILNQPEVLLSQRELEILGYIAADYSNQQIADKLVISVCTVKHHVHNILEKLKLRHRWDAVRFAAEQGWLEQKQ
jgi:two-component system nitrate/nitrite response regulator NarL